MFLFEFSTHFDCCGLGLGNVMGGIILNGGDFFGTGVGGRYQKR